MGHGLCADLVSAWVGAGVEMVLDERVRAEFFRIAETRFRANAQQLALAEDFFGEACIMAPAAQAPVPGIPDPDDAWIIAAALDAKAEGFVTGDKALLDLGQHEGMPILSPRAAYQRLRGLV